MEPWTHLGLWLSLWDEQGKCIEQIPQKNLFWSKLFKHSKRCRDRLNAIARRALQDDKVVAELDHHGGVFIIAVSLHHRRRIIGVVLACGLTHEFSNQETLARFCDLHKVDRLLFNRLVADVPRHPVEHVHAYADIISHHIELAGTSEVAHRNVRDLTSQLARTYEELNLIYRISNEMSVSNRPVDHFQKLCNELLEATVVESFAAVLDSPAEMLADPSVVTAGPLKASREDILRLYRLVRDHNKNAGSSFVINEAGSDPAFGWASSWLRQLVFFELGRNNHLFGGILAINHVDEKDFGSEEIQLINAVVERSSAFLESVRLYDDLEQLSMEMLHALVSSIDAKDPYTSGHSQRVAWLCKHVALLAGLNELRSQRVYLCGLLHDIGKIGISESVLCKMGRLTPEEFDEMKRHSEIGARILEGVRQVEDLVPGILHHHERIDGKGYPASLSGDKVPFLGRVVGLADSFDAMTTSRTYRMAMPVTIAAAEIRRCSGTQFDPLLADLLSQDDLHTISRKMAESANQPIAAYKNMGTRPVEGEWA